MQLRNIGTSGLRVSTIGLGCNNFGGRLDLSATRLVVDKAIDLGITLFDTADIYGNSGGSEEQLGEILGERRKDIVLATKFGMAMDKGRRRARRDDISSPRSRTASAVCEPTGLTSINYISLIR